MQEEAVDDRAGAAHVGAESPELEQPLGMRRRLDEVVRRQRGQVARSLGSGERVAQGGAPLLEVRGAVARSNAA